MNVFKRLYENAKDLNFKKDFEQHLNTLMHEKERDIS